jgi:hypothetical protein
MQHRSITLSTAFSHQGPHAPTHQQSPSENKAGILHVQPAFHIEQVPSSFATDEGHLVRLCFSAY